MREIEEFCYRVKGTEDQMVLLWWDLYKIRGACAGWLPVGGTGLNISAFGVTAKKKLERLLEKSGVEVVMKP